MALWGGAKFTSVGMGVSGFSLEYRNYKKLHGGLGCAKRSEGFRSIWGGEETHQHSRRAGLRRQGVRLA